MRGVPRGSRIQPIVWNQNQNQIQNQEQQQMMGGRLNVKLLTITSINIILSSGMPNRQQQIPFPSPPNRGQRARRGTRGRAASSSNYGNMRY